MIDTENTVYPKNKPLSESTLKINIEYENLILSEMLEKCRSQYEKISKSYDQISKLK